MTDQDQQFLQDMYSEGMAEVEGGHMAQQRSRDQAVKAFGQRMIEDHTQMDQELQALAKKLGVQVQNKIEEQTQHKIDQIQVLVGSEFDRAYLMFQIQDHERDIQKAQQHARQTQDSEIRQFAEKMADRLEQHLELARQALQTIQEQQPLRAR